MLKPQHPRLPPELLREIYTLPNSTSSSVAHTVAKPPETTTASEEVTPEPHTQTMTVIRASSFRTEGGFRVTSVTKSPVPAAQSDTQSKEHATSVIQNAVSSSGNETLNQLSNGRPGEPPLEDLVIPVAPPRPPTPHSIIRRGNSSFKKTSRLLNFGTILESQPCLPTLSSIASGKTARQHPGFGAANRLAAYNQTNSTLDLAKAAAVSNPRINYTHMSHYDPHTAVV